MNIRILIIRLKKILKTIFNIKLLRIFFKYGVLASFEHDRLLKLKFSFIVDIGAHTGQFALAARYYSNAKIISFEPLQDACNKFDEIFINDKDIKLIRTAIGQINTTKLINISAKSDSSSILEIGRNQEKYFPGTYKINTSEISIGPLDKFIELKDFINPALLKIDVQGYELETLRGCKKLISNFQYIYCECSFVELYEKQALASDIIIFLKEFNFDLIGTYNIDKLINGECIQADFLFQNNNT